MLNNNTLRYHHGHDHEHGHHHHHGEGHVHTNSDSVEDKNEKTLKILLVHWVNHNQSHEEGFREWVDKARAMGKDETANSIENAIEYLQKANDMLLEAKKHM